MDSGRLVSGLGSFFSINLIVFSIILPRFSVSWHLLWGRPPVSSLLSIPAFLCFMEVSPHRRETQRSRPRSAALFSHNLSFALPSSVLTSVSCCYWSPASVPGDQVLPVSHWLPMEAELRCMMGRLWGCSCRRQRWEGCSFDYQKYTIMKVQLIYWSQQITCKL